MTLIPVMPLWLSPVSDYILWGGGNRRHDNAPRSIGELFYSVRSELTAVTFAEALQTMLSLIDDIAITLDAAGCLRIGKLAKAKEVISDKISEWYSGITDYIKMYIQLPQKSQ